MTKSVPTPMLRTPGVIAGELGVPLHRVQYVLATRPHITPIATAGRIRLFDRDAVDLIRIELAKIDGDAGSAVNS
jgi:hypothetical protein